MKTRSSVKMFMTFSAHTYCSDLWTFKKYPSRCLPRKVKGKQPLLATKTKKKSLKVMTNEKQGRPGSWQMIDIGPIDLGDRCPFLFLFGRHLGLIKFPFPLKPAQ
jgi:hypothetical protein